MKSAWRVHMANSVFGAIGIGACLAFWQIAGIYRWMGSTWPPLTSIVHFIANPLKQNMLINAARATFSMAALGYGIGVVCGLLLAVTVHLISVLKPGIDRLAAFINAVPPIVLAPILLATVDRDKTSAVLTALCVFFTVYVATTSGFLASTRTHRDLLTSLGASRVRRLWLLDLPAGLPTIMNGMKLAVSGAFVGVILGEWFGASHGLGLLMVSAMQNMQVAQLWSVVVITTIGAALAYVILAGCEQLVRRRFQ